MVSYRDLCRDDLEYNGRCFLKHGYYAHTTKEENLTNIRDTGIRVMPQKDRVHTYFDRQLQNECKRLGVYDLACKARDGSTYHFADFQGAIDHAIYMGTLLDDIQAPAIIISTLSSEKVSIDPENHRYVSDFTAIEQHIQTEEYQSEPLAVQHIGEVTPEQIKYICTLSDDFQSQFRYHPETFFFDNLDAQTENHLHQLWYQKMKENQENIKDLMPAFTLPECPENDFECYDIAINNVLNLNELDEWGMDMENYAIEEMLSEELSFGNFVKSMTASKKGKITETTEAYYDFEENIYYPENWDCTPTYVTF